MTEEETKKGIKELTEVLDAISCITKTSFEVFSDGFQFEDLTQFMPMFSKVKDALSDVEDISDELKDLDLKEIKFICTWGIDFASDILEMARNLKKSE